MMSTCDRSCPVYYHCMLQVMQYISSIDRNSKAHQTRLVTWSIVRQKRQSNRQWQQARSKTMIVMVTLTGVWFAGLKKALTLAMTSSRDASHSAVVFRRPCKPLDGINFNLFLVGWELCALHMKWRQALRPCCHCKSSIPDRS